MKTFEELLKEEPKELQTIIKEIKETIEEMGKETEENRYKALQSLAKDNFIILGHLYLSLRSYMLVFEEYFTDNCFLSKQMKENKKKRQEKLNKEEIDKHE